MSLSRVVMRRFQSGVQNFDRLLVDGLVQVIRLHPLSLLSVNLRGNGIDLAFQVSELLLRLDRFVGGRGRRPVVRVDDSGARTARPAKRGHRWRPKAADIGWGATTGRGRERERGSGGGRKERGVDPERYKGSITGRRGKEKEEHRSDSEPRPPRWVEHVLVMCGVSMVGGIKKQKQRIPRAPTQFYFSDASLATAANKAGLRTRDKDSRDCKN